MAYPPGKAMESDLGAELGAAPELDFSDSPKPEKKAPRIAKPKIELVEVLNIHDKVSFTAPDGKRITQGKKAWVTKKQAMMLLKRNIVEVINEESW